MLKQQAPRAHDGFFPRLGGDLPRYGGASSCMEARSAADGSAAYLTGGSFFASECDGGALSGEAGDALME